MSDKIEKLKDLLKLLSESLTRKEFEDAFSALLKQLLELEKRLTQKIDFQTNGEVKSAVSALQQLQKEFRQIIETAKNESDNTLAGFKRKTIETINTLFIKSRVNEKLHSVLAECLAKLPLMDSKMKEMDNKMSEIHDGRDADEEKKEETPEKLRDKLETLKEDERLEIKAIRDLSEKLEELEKKIGKRPIFGGGGFSKIAMDIHIIDGEVVSGSGTSWTLSHAPSPATSLKLYANGQRLTLTTDYTILGLVITTINSFSAGTILADFNI